MKLFEIFESSPMKSVDNLSKIQLAVKNQTAAKLTVGESTITISNNTAKYLFDLYETARVSGNADRFMKALAEGSGIIMENPETLAHIVNRFPHEVKSFVNGEELDEELYHALFDYYSMHGEMPYGVAKAKTDDPFVWVADRFANDVFDYTDEEPELPESMYSDQDLFALGEGKKAKPDFLDADKDGNKKEPMKKALKDKEQVEEGWDDMIKAGEKRRSEKQTGEKWKTHRGEAEKTSTGVIHRRSYDPKTGESDEPKDDGSGEPAEKRGRGRPRTRPVPDANAPKRGRGRPRTRPEADPNTPKRGRGRPKKVREWIESLRYIAESSKA